METLIRPDPHASRTGTPPKTPATSTDPFATNAASHAASATLYAAAGGSRDAAEIGAIFQLVAAGLTHTAPLPARGRTLHRWRFLSDIAGYSLPLVKLVEGHLDAVAILHELGAQELIQADDAWAVWCAEPPGMRVTAAADAGRSDAGAHVASGAASMNGQHAVRLSGIKPWCSGAASVRRALVSVWNEDGQACLAAVDMAADGVRVTHDGWQAVGMGPTASINVEFDRAPAVLIGAPGAYADRPGFLHGAAGVAACWYGACAAIAGAVREAVRRRPDDAHAQAHLGAIDVALAQAACQMRACAAAIDDRPDAAPALLIGRVRLAVEQTAQTVLERAPRALGPAPFCKNAVLAGLLADLPVYLRQSHAERDLAVHGRALADAPDGTPWIL